MPLGQRSKAPVLLRKNHRADLEAQAAVDALILVDDVDHLGQSMSLPYRIKGAAESKQTPPIQFLQVFSIPLKVEGYGHIFPLA